MERVIHVEVAKLDGAVFFEWSVEVPQLAVDQGKSRSVYQHFWQIWNDLIMSFVFE